VILGITELEQRCAAPARFSFNNVLHWLENWRFLHRTGRNLFSRQPFDTGGPLFHDALNATQFTLQLTGAGGESSPVVNQKGNSHQ
jgi:hypothetical protein